MSSTGFVPSPTTAFSMDAINGFLESPTNKTYVLDESAAFSYNINTLISATVSGSATAAIQINGVSVTGMSAVSITSVQGTATASSSNTVHVGDKVTLVLSSIASAADLAFTMSIVRN